MGNEEGKDPSRRVSQTTGCFQNALEGSWKGQRGQSSGIESRHQRRDGRPGARGQRDTDTLPHLPTHPNSTLGLCFQSVLLSKHIQLYINCYLNPNVCVCVCVCVCVYPESQPHSHLHSPQPRPSHVTSYQCTPRGLLPGPWLLACPLHCPQKLQKPGKTLPESVPLLLRPLPCSPVLPSECPSLTSVVSTPISLSTALPLSQPLSCSDRPTSGLGTGCSGCWMPFP